MFELLFLISFYKLLHTCLLICSMIYIASGIKRLAFCKSQSLLLLCTSPLFQVSILDGCHMSDFEGNKAELQMNFQYHFIKIKLLYIHELKY